MTEEEKRAIVEEAEKKQPDIWSDEYFPYWEKVCAQFEDEESTMKSYKVTHYHDRIFNRTSAEDFTVYRIEAKTPKDAAVIAHGRYNGYTEEEMRPDPASPSRTIRERLEDEVKLAPIGKNTEERSAFNYGRIAGHVITVELMD